MGVEVLEVLVRLALSSEEIYPYASRVVVYEGQRIFVVPDGGGIYRHQVRMDELEWSSSALTFVV